MTRIALLLFVAATCMRPAAAAVQCPPGITVHDGNYRSTKGFLAYAPEGATASDTLGIVVFIHGYGALNPLNYGQWLRRIVEAGNVVIYPRYQHNLFIPGSKRFARNASQGISGGLAWAQRQEDYHIDTESLVYIGHSYGGTLSAYMLARQDSLGLPPAYGALLAAPGTSRLHGSRLDSYANISFEAQLLMVTHGGDYVVGDEFATLVDSSAPSTLPRAWVQQVTDVPTDTTLTYKLGQGHNECYAVDMDFDTGYRNYTTKRALRIGKVNAVDTLLYWPLSDQLLASAKTRTTMPILLPDAPTVYAMGNWPDGSKRTGLSMIRVVAKQPATDAHTSVQR